MFGLQPSGYRAHGLLWLLLLVVGLGAILRRVLPGPVGALALLIFAISGIHGILCWTATRHITIAAALGVVGLSAHLRWRQEQWTPGLFISVAGLALALAGGYVLLYSAFAFGVSPDSGYITPLSHPVRFLDQLPGRLAVLLGAIVLGGNADMWVLRPALRPVPMMIGAIAVTLFLVLLWTAWRESPPGERRLAGWMSAGVFLSAMVFAGTPIGSRCLVVPLIGGAVSVSLVLCRWWSGWHRRGGFRYRVLGAMCVGLAAIHLVVGPAERLASPVLLRRMMFEDLRSAMTQAELSPDGLERRTVVVLRAPGLVAGFHSYFYRTLYRLPMPRSWRVLS